MKNATVETIIMLFICFNMMVSVMAQTAGLKNGDWISYTLNISFFGTAVSGSMTVRIQSVTGTTVSGTVEVSITGYELPASQFSINTATGAGTGHYYEAPGTLIIPANLTAGQAIPGMVGTTITGVTDRAYAGASRKVVYATANVPQYGIASSYYWDRETGVLLEVSGSMTSQGQTLSYSFVASGTNMWAGAGFFGLDWWIWVVIAVAAVGIIAGVFLFMRKKKPPVAQPSAPLPTPPPPPPPPTSLS